MKRQKPREREPSRSIRDVNSRGSSLVLQAHIAEGARCQVIAARCQVIAASRLHIPLNTRASSDDHFKLLCPASCV